MILYGSSLIPVDSLNELITIKDHRYTQNRWSLHFCYNISNMKTKIYKPYFFISISLWYIVAISVMLFPFSWDIIFSEQISYSIYNNLIDLIATISLFLFIFDFNRTLKRKLFLRLIFSGVLLILPVLFLLARISDLLR